jgi:hypothetical protein
MFISSWLDHLELGAEDGVHITRVVALYGRAG